MFLFLTYSYCLFSTYFTAFVSTKNFKTSIEKKYYLCFILVLLLESSVLEKRIIWIDGKWDRYFLCITVLTTNFYSCFFFINNKITILFTSQVMMVQLKKKNKTKHISQSFMHLSMIMGRTGQCNRERNPWTACLLELKKKKKFYQLKTFCLPLSLPPVYNQQPQRSS